jgi:hypothetical protein
VEEIRNAYKILGGKRERQDYSAGLRTDVTTIKTDYKEIWRESVDFTQLAHNRNYRQALVNKVINLWFLGFCSLPE